MSSAEGLVGEAPERSGGWPAPVAAPRGNAVPFWGLMFFTFVLFIAPQLMFPSLAPLHLAKVSAGLAVVAYVVNRLVNRRPLTVAGPEVLLVALFTVVALNSIPLSLSPRGSLEFFLGWFLRSVILFFLIANLLETLGRLRLFITSIVLWGVVIAATGLHNFATGQMYRNSDRIWGYTSGLAANPDDLGLVLNVILALTVGIFLATRRRAVKALLLVVMAMAAAGVIVSFSRGAFLALAVTLAVILAKLVRAHGPLALAAAAVLLVLGIALAPAGYGERLYSLFDWNLDRVGSIDRRWQELQVAFAYTLDNPLIGAGLGMDTLVFVEQGLGHGWETHNIFLQVGADLGLPGLVVYVLLIAQVLRGLRRTQRQFGLLAETREVVAIAAGLELAVWTFLAGAFFLTVPYDFTFFYLAGMAVALRVIGARLAAPALPAR